MRLMSLTALFTALAVEVSSCSEDVFKLDRLSTAIPSQDFTVLFLPLASIWRFLSKKTNLKTSSRGIYSNHWNIGFNCVTLCFLNKGLGWKVSKSFALEYKCFPHKQIKRQFSHSAWGDMLAYCLQFSLCVSHQVSLVWKMNTCGTAYINYVSHSGILLSFAIWKYKYIALTIKAAVGKFIKNILTAVHET